MNHERFLCSLDPISLTGLALGALAGGGTALASGALGGGSTPAAPAAPVAPPTTIAQPVQQPTGQSPAPKSQAPSFLGAAATPPVQSGSKTLLGA
jgi:hypothetical protein